MKTNNEIIYRGGISRMGATIVHRLCSMRYKNTNTYQKLYYMEYKNERIKTEYIHCAPDRHFLHVTSHTFAANYV